MPLKIEICNHDSVVDPDGSCSLKELAKYYSLLVANVRSSYPDAEITIPQTRGDAWGQVTCTNPVDQRLTQDSIGLIAEGTYREWLRARAWMQPSREDILLSYKGGADFRGVDFCGVDLSNTSIPDINLNGAILRGATFHKTQLAGAQLRNATLYRADLRDADLTGANLAGANLANAKLQGAIMLNANFAESTGIRWAVCGWFSHGEIGRILLGVIVNGEARYFCGCFSGTEAELREYISKDPTLAPSRIAALEFVAAKLKE